MDDEMRELLDSFIVETQEILENLDQDLMALETSGDDPDMLNSIFRSFHTIKGTSSFMGFDQITKITHQAEDILNKLRRNELQVDSTIVDVLLEVYDWLKVLAEKIVNNDSSPVDFDATMEKLTQINNGGKPVAAPAPAAAPPQTSGADKSEPEIDDSELAGTEALSSVLDNPDFASGDGDFTDEELEMLQQAFEQVDRDMRTERSDAPDAAADDAPKAEEQPEAEAQPEAQAQPETPAAEAPGSISPAKAMAQANGKQDRSEVRKPHVETTIRVDVERLESLMDLSGELVLGRNRLAQITTLLNETFDSADLVRELAETSSQINFITTELQSAIMKTRMVPIAKLFQKAPRMVRDLSRDANKNIELKMTGEETELDRGIIEELGDPLVHMIRNSCDHGIETPEERTKNGKSAKGTLQLDAEHEGNHIVIRIKDDGKGIDPEVIKNKAVDKKIITAEKAMMMSDREAYTLIFAPGFSTAAAVTKVSGRGVGMDVVRTNIQKLKGIIDIDSELGKGTTMTIKLPLTLAIIQGLLVSVGSEVFAIPLNSVIEVVATEDCEINHINKNSVIRIRDQVIPLVRLQSSLSIPRDDADDLGQERYVVVVGIAEHRIGLVVDHLQGQKEIVIKTLGEYLGHVPGIAGSTILGDGRVIMIIDIAELVREQETEVI